MAKTAEWTRKEGKNAKGEPKGIPEGQTEGSLNQFSLAIKRN